MVGWPAGAIISSGRLTNDYAGATFAKTKKTLSLNHKKPLPEARTRHIIHGHLDERFARPFSRPPCAAICQALFVSSSLRHPRPLPVRLFSLNLSLRLGKILPCLSSS